MATFSENQVRHLYVVNNGTNFSAHASGEGMYFNVLDAAGATIRTDIIENIISAKAIGAVKMARKTTVARIAMDSSLLVSNAPIAGEDYTLRIEYRQFIGLSDEEMYHEFASAHATASSTVNSLLLDLATNLAANTAKQGLVKVYLVEATSGGVETNVLVSAKGPASSLTSGSDYVAILVEEIEQPWVRGIKQETPVLFKVSTGVVGADSLAWGTVTDTTASDGTTINNGKKVADLEYFLMGERVDIYRNMGWPQVTPWEKTLMVDPTAVYDVIDIHYAYVGANHSIQKSEKTITIVCPQAAGAHTVANAVINKINAVKANLLSTLS